MKHKNIVYVLIIVIVLVFSIAALGAKNSEESKYIGTWKGSNGQIVILPCHTGEFLNDKGESKMTFTWELDNGYLVTHEYKNMYYSSVGGEIILSYLSTDGKTMKCLSKDTNFSKLYSKAE